MEEDEPKHREGGAHRADEGRRAPEKPSDLPSGSSREILKRAFKEYKADNLPDLAAALTYYAILAIFPALLALVSIVGLLSKSTAASLTNNIISVAPGAVRSTLTSIVAQVQTSGNKALIPLIIGVAVALWSASGYVAAFMRAGNAVYDIGEGRPAWKTLPIRFAITVFIVIAMAAIAVGIVFTGSLAHKTGSILGLGDTAVTVWNYAKWPVMILLFSMVVAVLHWAAPNVRHSFAWVTRGSLLSIGIWIAASALFAVYVANFGSYNKTYGTFAGIIVFLIWLWISNIALLLGLEYSAESERARAHERGQSLDEEPYVEPRDEPGP
ncbi:YihY/virulence factor BrkB family protein [Actinacidiphila acidipaludis]|uniref:YihY/virulence factor BrkB family protein n=1 Tax=Actinacidiphila acidipaludis TaxID=2873382 RepID=A0ABS7PZ12_9ACTN|nr:YihY/virulence factor BrkB family protein [Streptomyces acidipaludis]MBY8876103.1 YihY/virulence factor BrkB family protein [Streptomyces acidipaludis]